MQMGRSLLTDSYFSLYKINKVKALRHDENFELNSIRMLRLGKAVEHISMSYY